MTRREQQIVQCIPRLRRYARALLKDRDRSEDLVQETLAKALSKLSFWIPGSDMRAWLFTIMHNQFINDYRRHQRQPISSSLDDQSIQEPTSSSSAEQLAHLDDIEAALMQLPQEQRSVLLLVSLEGLSYAKTAKVLGIKVGTVMSRLHRARERMRKLMAVNPRSTIQTIRGVK